MTSSMHNRHFNKPKSLRGRYSLCNMDVEFGSDLGEIEEVEIVLCMFATRGFAPLIRGFAPFQIFAFGGCHILFKPKQYSNYETII